MPLTKAELLALANLNNDVGPLLKLLPQIVEELVVARTKLNPPKNSRHLFVHAVKLNRIDKDDERVTITFDADHDLNKEIVERATELLKAGTCTIGDLVRALNGTSE